MMAATTETQDPLSIVYDEGLQPVYHSQAAIQAPEVVTAYNQGISEAPQHVDNQGEARAVQPGSPSQLSACWGSA